ncbi:MAG: hypothetical protein FWC77_07860 [Defluviitaleaceae bacterium]|nr:hypothetical protein [Defluviitaleaceae bacterium]
MLAAKEMAIGYINKMSEERVISALDYLRFLYEQRLPFEVTSKDELYSKIDEGLEDMQQGRVQPYKDAMQDIRKELTQYGV